MKQKDDRKRLPNVDIQRVDSRERLQQFVRSALKAGEPVSRDAYWKELSRGRYVGYRFFTADSAGTWLARFYDGARYHWQPLGDFSEFEEKRRFDAARKAAEEWFDHLEAGGAPKSGTVRQACEAFVEFQRHEKSEAAALDAAGRFKRLVYGDPERSIKPDPIANVELAKLHPRHFADWKARVLARAKANGDKNPRGSYNRNATALRAAMNLAKRRKQVVNDHWKEELKPFTRDEHGKDVARSRKLYLNPEARRKLIECSSDEARPLLRAMNLQPVRPGDIPAARVEDLDMQHRTLSLRGKGKDREIPLGREAFDHFKACARNKLPGAWLVSRADGSQWKKEAWRDEIKLAAAAAKLPRATVAYTFRHSVITDLINSGLHVASVAALAGTSIAMIEKNYFKLLQEHARKALDKLAAMA